MQDHYPPPASSSFFHHAAINNINASSPGGGSGNGSANGSSPVPNPAGGLSRANSLARTRAVATLKRAVSARELKREASQNRHDHSTSPIPPPNLDISNRSEQQHHGNPPRPHDPRSETATGPELRNGAESEAAAGTATDGGASAIAAYSGAFAANLPAPIPQAPSSDVAAAVSVLAAAAAARNGLAIGGSAATSGGPSAFAPTLAYPEQGLVPSSMPATPPVARTPPHLAMPGPSMTSQVARTYAMAKLLGAAGLQREAVEEPMVTPDPISRPTPEPTIPSSGLQAEADEPVFVPDPISPSTPERTSLPSGSQIQTSEQIVTPDQRISPVSERRIQTSERVVTPDERISPTSELGMQAYESPLTPDRSSPAPALRMEANEPMVNPDPAPLSPASFPPYATSEQDSVHLADPDESVNVMTSVTSLDSPGLLLSATVNQIISPSKFEEKFLLLFKDTLVLAKPLAPPEGLEGAPRLRAEALMEKPDLDWSFSVERIIHLHRVGLIVHRDRLPVSKPHALMPSFVRHFSSNAEGAIEQLISLTGLGRDAKTIAKLLYQTPDLDPQQLCEYICSARRKDVLDAYIGLHAVTGVSIESGLRSFLLGIRFPADQQAFKTLLISFSKHWVSSNRSLIKPAFSAGLAANLVFYIMALNDALHTTESSSRQMFSGPRPNYNEEDFLLEFRKLDAFAVLSDRTLGRIFSSVRAEPIQQALPAREGPRLSVRVAKGLPTKLSPHVSSGPITVVIDRADADFAVRVYGKDFVFEPPVLSFAKSNSCSFTITPRSLDARTITFVKIGRRAPHYVAVPSSESAAEVALPKSFNVTIEPRELRHTFSLTIAKGDSVKHKITLSAENGHRKRVITNALKERIDICISKKRERNRGQAAVQAAASAAASSSNPDGRSGREGPSPIPPLNPSGAEKFSFCEPAAGSFLRRVYNNCTPFVVGSASSSLAPSPLIGGESSGSGTGGGSAEVLKPCVTLTFAQSLDAKIAGVGGKQLILSGEESMLMTHSLRTLHDGILVGAGTAVNDNPQLNARLLPDIPPVERLPRPIVLDTHLRTPPNCKLLLNYQKGTGRQPLLVCARTASGIRAAELEQAGAELVVANCEFDDLLSWRSVLAALARKGITRLMVEGGATVISGLLASQFVDTLIVTVAPKLIGPQGISHNATLPLAGPSATGERGASEDFDLVTSRQFGRDVVFAWRRKER
ncbi:unnamed protein product [Tilletia caries]|nr:hypothetical protein CF336_g5703 [Tilletia laevis]CAD6926232.1 unnamed protein product [Tilletia caries]